MQQPSRKKKSKKASKPKPSANGDVEAMPAMAQHAQATRQPLSLPQLSQFFNSLVQLVPPRFYFDTAGEMVNLKHMKKREKELAKAAIKTKGKVCTASDGQNRLAPQPPQANKRAKLDPEAAQTTLDVQKQHAKQREQQREAWLKGDEQGDEQGNDQPTQPSATPGFTLNLDAVDSSKEQLRERLRVKLEVFRAQRHAEERDKAADEARRWRQKKLANGSTKAVDGKVAANGASPHKDTLGKRSLGGEASDSGSKRKRQTAVPDARSSLDEDIRNLAFGNISVTTTKQAALKAWDHDLATEGKRKNKPKVPLTDTAHGNGAPPDDAAGDGEVGEDAWRAALLRARGEKVLDDPRLLRRSAKREAKAKAKRKQTWQQRVKQQADEQASRQQRRNDNLNKRVQAKMDKKKAKREKKLMRAGFEGRKAGFINGA